ncbi:WD40-repeat-containing domain protein [Sparassis latifolia]
MLSWNAFSPPVITLMLNGVFQIWKGDVVEYTLDGHTAMTWAFEVTTDGRLLISLSDDDTIWIWNTTNGSAIHNIKCSARLGFVSLVPDGSFIAHGQEGGKIDLWSVKKGRIIKQFKLHSDKVSDAVFTPSGEKMLTGSADMTMKVWDMATILSGAAAQSEVDENTQEASQSAVPSICDDMPHNGLFVGHKFPIWPLDISQDGQWAVSGDDQGMVHIWDVKTTVVQCVLQGHNNTGYQSKQQADSH